MKITFLGATKTVTGSNFLLEAAGKKIIVDCGLYHGKAKEERENYTDFPFNVNVTFFPARGVPLISLSVMLYFPP